MYIELIIAVDNRAQSRWRTLGGAVEQCQLKWGPQTSAVNGLLQVLQEMST